MMTLGKFTEEHAPEDCCWTWWDAIEAAAAAGYTLNKHADPTAPAREDISAGEANEVASEDGNLIYLTVTLEAVETDGGEWVVQDPTGGTWVPSEVAQALIEECEDPAAYAVALCEEQPMAGEWRQ